MINIGVLLFALHGITPVIALTTYLLNAYRIQWIYIYIHAEVDTYAYGHLIYVLYMQHPSSQKKTKLPLNVSLKSAFGVYVCEFAYLEMAVYFECLSMYFCLVCVILMYVVLITSALGAAWSLSLISLLWKSFLHLDL